MTKETLTPLQQELLGRADAVFASIGTAVGKATDYAAVQIPDIAMQYILYYRVYLTSVIVIALLVLIVQQVLSIRWLNKALKDKATWDKDGYILIYGVLTLITSLATLLPTFSNFKDLLLVWFAPKVFLIEHMVHLAKSMH